MAIVQGHPDPGRGHLCHGLADAYADGAAAAGHTVMRLETAQIDFPMLRSQQDFEAGQLPSMLVPARDAIVSARHLVIIFPLWHGTMPALLKAFLEQVMRPGIAGAVDAHTPDAAGLRQRREIGVVGLARFRMAEVGRQLAAAEIAALQAADRGQPGKGGRYGDRAQEGPVGRSAPGAAP